MKSHPPSRGFTLVELLVVVGIILLITAISIPAFSSLFSGQGIAKAARLAQTTVMNARNRAVGVGRQQMVLFRNDDEGTPGNTVIKVRDAGEDQDGDGNPWLTAGSDWEPAVFNGKPDGEIVGTVQIPGGFTWGKGRVAGTGNPNWPVVICMPDGTLKIYKDVTATPFLSALMTSADTDAFNSVPADNNDLAVQNAAGDSYFIKFMKSAGRAKIRGEVR